MHSQDNGRILFPPATVAALEAAARARTPLDGLQARAAWRDDRLLALAAHKRGAAPPPLPPQPT